MAATPLPYPTGTNNSVIWIVGPGYGGDFDVYDGQTGASLSIPGLIQIPGLHRFGTAIVARGRIYVAADNQVYAFNVGPSPTPPSISSTNLIVLTNGDFQFAFTNTANALFNAFATTDPSQPLANWTWLGEVPEVAPGQYQFTDTSGITNAEMFYTVTSP